MIVVQWVPSGPSAFIHDMHAHFSVGRIVLAIARHWVVVERGICKICRTLLDHGSHSVINRMSKSGTVGSPPRHGGRARDPLE